MFKPENELLHRTRTCGGMARRYAFPYRATMALIGEGFCDSRNARGQIQPLKQRINIYLDAAIVEHFKKKAGARGYQTLFNEALKHSIRR